MTEKAAAIVTIPATPPSADERIAVIEVRQDQHEQQLGVLQTTVKELTKATNRLSFRIAVGLVVIFSGTENGGELLRWAVSQITN